MRDDPDGISKNYSQRKAVASYDPYNEESQYAAIRYEDENKLRASMILQSYKTALKPIFHSANEMDLKDQERLMQVDVLLRRLGEIKVIDAPVLLKLYHMYRYQLHD
jgi:hypothetical protein